jgi:osmotically-inducible protein OsmY
MRSFHARILTAGIVLALVGCQRGEEPEEAPEADVGLTVPDTTIVREVNTRMEADPRLDAPDIELEAHATDGEVTLVGQVPSRFELSIAREVAMSTPGVKQVWLDSVRVLSEAGSDQPADTAAPART